MSNANVELHWYAYVKQVDNFSIMLYALSSKYFDNQNI